MKLYFSVFLFIFFTGSATSQAVRYDTLSLQTIHQARTLQDLTYQLPDTLSIRHFVIVFKFKGMEPISSYHAETKFDDDTLQFLARIGEGDRIDIVEIYGYKEGASQEELLPEQWIRAK
jgi:hypothetical protein